MSEFETNNHAFVVNSHEHICQPIPRDQSKSCDAPVGDFTAPQDSRTLPDGPQVGDLPNSSRSEQNDQPATEQVQPILNPTETKVLVSSVKAEQAAMNSGGPLYNVAATIEHLDTMGWEHIKRSIMASEAMIELLTHVRELGERCRELQEDNKKLQEQIKDMAEAFPRMHEQMAGMYLEMENMRWIISQIRH